MAIKGLRRAIYLQLTLLALLLVWASPAIAQVTNPADTATADTAQTQPDTLSILQSPSALDAQISYKASDSVIFNVRDKKAYLYDSAEMLYKDIKLNANYIALDWTTNQITAAGVKDSAGILQGKPVFSEKGDEFNADTFIYDFGTKKGIITGLVRKEGEGYLLSERIKTVKEGDKDVIYAANARYTTCDDTEHPHFYIQTKRLKLIPNDKVLTGGAQFHVLDIPTPIFLPFGFFPANSRKSSGIIIPAFGSTAQQGYSLKNGGFYYGNSKYWDLALTGDIYTSGSYRISSVSQYARRYRFNGSLALSYARIYNSLYSRDTKNEGITRDFFVRWSHATDPKASPTTSFSADVNAGSKTYLRNNSNDVNDLFQQALTSSVNFSKRFPGTPFSINSTARHTQNLQTGQVDLNLPTMTVNMSRVQPFKPKVVTKSKWYHDVGVTYSLNFDNRLSTYDSLFGQSFKLDSFDNGFRQTASLSTNFSLGPYLTLSPSANYTGFAYFETYRQEINDTGGLDIITVPGFSYAHNYNVNVSANTRLFSMLRFKGGPVEAVRHVLSPRFTLTYAPDFGASKYGYYQPILYDTLPKERIYSIYQGTIYGGPGQGENGSLSVGLNNNLEMKVRQKTDSGMVSKKVKLIERLDINGGYNFLADSFKLSQITLSGATIIYQKINIQFGGLLDPYYLRPEDSVRMNRYAWQEGQGLGRFRQANLTFTTSLNPQANGAAGLPYYDPRLYLFYPVAQADFSIPWNLSLSYNLIYNNPLYFFGDPRLFKPVTQTVYLSGEINLTPKWKVRGTTNYDISNKNFSSSQINIYRDLHCWEASFDWVPFGIRKSYWFTLRIKAPTLKDLKVEKKQDYLDNF